MFEIFLHSFSEHCFKGFENLIFIVFLKKISEFGYLFALLAACYHFDAIHLESEELVTIVSCSIVAGVYSDAGEAAARVRFIPRIFLPRQLLPTKLITALHPSAHLLVAENFSDRERQAANGTSYHVLLINLQNDF